MIFIRAEVTEVLREQRQQFRWYANRRYAMIRWCDTDTTLPRNTVQIVNWRQMAAIKVLCNTLLWMVGLAGAVKGPRTGRHSFHSAYSFSSHAGYSSEPANRINFKLLRAFFIHSVSRFYRCFVTDMKYGTSTLEGK